MTGNSLVSLLSLSNDFGNLLKFVPEKYKKRLEKISRLKEVVENLLPSISSDDTLSEEVCKGYSIAFYCSGAAIVIIGIAYITLVHLYFFQMHKKGMQIRIACCHLVYRKALKLSHKALGQTNVGQMVNLLSNDVNRFDVYLNCVPYILVAPLQAIVCIGYMYFYNFGWPVFAGAAPLLLFIPFQLFMANLFSKVRNRAAIIADERIRLMNELIPSMRVIKMYCWEKPFAKLVESIRRREVALLKIIALLRSVDYVLAFVLSKIMIFVTFILYILYVDPEFDTQHVFVAITLFGSLRITFTLFLSSSLSQGSELLVTIYRLQVQ